MLRIISKHRGLLSFRFSSSKPPTRPDKQTIEKMQNQVMDHLEAQQQSSKTQKPKLTWILGLAVVGITAGYFVSKYFQKVDKKEEELIKRIDNPTFGGNWKMYGLDGSTITDKDLIGKNYIMYFGFTRCPDVCPAFLFKLTAAMKYISQHKSSQMFTLIPVFVSLDPEYDTPERIQKFLSNYHPSTLALYTPPQQRSNLDNIMKQFNVYANKIPFGESYSIDHSVIGYLMSEDGKFLCLLGPNLSSKEMASKIEEELTYIQTIKLKKHASYI